MKRRAPDDTVLCSQRTDEPLSRSQRWRIVRRAARAADSSGEYRGNAVIGEVSSVQKPDLAKRLI